MSKLSWIRLSKNQIVVALILLLAFATPVHAATPKAGAKCTKAGATATAGGKKFTCVKSGSKLMWDKGLAILLQPLFTAIPAANNYEWDITVTNYQGRNSLGLDFSYSFAVDGGIWNLFSKTKMPKEKIVINQSFKFSKINTLNCSYIN